MSRLSVFRLGVPRHISLLRPASTVQKNLNIQNTRLYFAKPVSSTMPWARPTCCSKNNRLENNIRTVSRQTRPYSVSTRTRETIRREAKQNELDKVWNLKTVEVISKTKMKPEGSRFLVRYADTMEYVCQEAHGYRPTDLPVVLGLHGTPGSCQDLMSSLAPLAEKGYRVILPDLPGFGDTRGVEDDWDDNFLQRLVERSNFVVNLLKTLGVERKLSLLACHSSGGYPSTYLASHYPEFTSSLLLICPGIGYKNPIPVFSPWFVEVCLRAWESNVMFKKIMEHFATVMSKLIPVQFGDNFDLIRRTSRTLLGIDYSRMAEHAVTVGSSSVPVTYVYCDGDPVLGTWSSRKYATMFGVSQVKTDVYDADLNLVTEGIVDADLYRKGVMFTRKTHYPPKHEDLRQIIHSEVFKLISAGKRTEIDRNSEHGKEPVQAGTEHAVNV